MGQWHTPQAKTEEALRRLFAHSEDDLQSVQVLSRFSNKPITLPMIRILCQAAPYGAESGDAITSGNWRVSATIRVTTHYKSADGDGCDPTDVEVIEHDRIAAVVMDSLFTDDLPKTLNDLMQDEDFTAQMWTPGSCVSSEPSDGRLITEISCEIVMAPSQL
jgi:hypothetical protein